MAFLFHTHQRPMLYWALGSLIVFLIPPGNLVDILMAPKWHAPHWQCDSLGIPIMQTLMGMPFWTAFSICVSGAITYLCARSRPSGDFVLAMGRPRTPWGYIGSIIVFVVAVILLWDVVKGIWYSIKPISFIADCGGRAEPIQVTMRRPWLQLSPLLQGALVLWLFHMRALAVARR